MVDSISFGPGRIAESRKTSASKVESNANAPQTLHTTAALNLSTLTAMARELAAAEPPLDYAKIAQIRQAIALGSYKIDSHAITNAMLRHFGTNAL